jgi:tRNA-specific 2-thiouridylase
LTKALFPIGELTKPQVREIASKLDLITAEKKILKDYVLLEKLVCPNFYNKNYNPKKDLF